jgi:ubiquinone/menaquinone biosynthesis C-methylase UbiE
MAIENSTIKEMVRAKWNKRALTYDRSPGHGIQNSAEHQRWIELFREVFGEKKLKILDVGTGTGVIALLLAELGHQVTGVDIAEDMLRQAREKAARMGLEPDFRVGDVETLDFEEASFDAVVNRHVVWTLPHPEKAMADWKRLLRPGGELVIMDSNSGKGMSFAKKIWRFCGRILILLTEGSNPWANSAVDRAMEKHFPMRQRKRPEADLEMLKKLGFEATVMTLNIKRWHTLLDYLKYGFMDKERFLIRARLPETGGKTDS